MQYLPRRCRAVSLRRWFALCDQHRPHRAVWQPSGSGVYEIRCKLSQNPLLPRTGGPHRAVHHHDERCQVRTLHRSVGCLPNRLLCALFRPNVCFIRFEFESVMTPKPRLSSVRRTRRCSTTATSATTTSCSRWAVRTVTKRGGLKGRREARQVPPAELRGRFALSALQRRLSRRNLIKV